MGERRERKEAHAETRRKTTENGLSSPLNGGFETPLTVRPSGHARYVPTEIGMMPESWPVRRFDSVFSVQQGKQVSKSKRAGENQRPFLRTKNVFWGRLDVSELDAMHFTEQEINRLALVKDDLLVCEGGSIGRTAIWDGSIADCY
ncbi:MAG: hypothetical protein PHV28_02430, partial [Kiritimatiellae bacterium]|nr:hypothetical protein [Kiritimatiellia bacterium]